MKKNYASSISLLRILCHICLSYLMGYYALSSLSLTYAVGTTPATQSGAVNGDILSGTTLKSTDGEIIKTSTGKVLGINDLTLGWQILQKQYVMLSVWTECKNVQSPDGYILFVPTRSQIEWQAFKAGAPLIGAILSDCVSAVPDSCNTVEPPCKASGTCTLTTGTPTSVSQAWNKGATSCGYNCTGGYTGSRCDVAPAPTCTSFTYTPTQACQANGRLSVAVVASSPAGCVGGSPATSQSCTYVPPPMCTSFTYYPGECQPTGWQDLVAVGSPTGCVGGSPRSSQECTYVPPSYTVTFDGWGGTGYSPTTITRFVNTPIGTLPSNPTRAGGWEFEYWADYSGGPSNSCNGTQISPSTLVTQDITYVAKYKYPIITTLDGNGGTGHTPSITKYARSCYGNYYSTETIRLGTYVTPPTRGDGYYFKGWYDSRTGGKEYGYNDIYTPKLDTPNILYAQWGKDCTSSYTQTVNGHIYAFSFGSRYSDGESTLGIQTDHPIPHGKSRYEQVFKCNVGVPTPVGSEAFIKTECVNGYRLEGDQCVPRSIEVGVAQYQSENYFFQKFTLYAFAPQTKTSNPLTIPHGTAWLTTTFTLDPIIDNNILWTDQSLKITCDSGYSVNNSWHGMDWYNKFEYGCYKNKSWETQSVITCASSNPGVANKTIPLGTQFCQRQPNTSGYNACQEVYGNSWDWARNILPTSDPRYSGEGMGLIPSSVPCP